MQPKNLYKFRIHMLPVHDIHDFDVKMHAQSLRE